MCLLEAYNETVCWIAGLSSRVVLACFLITAINILTSHYQFLTEELRELGQDETDSRDGSETE